jgi:hypothetical protein
MPKHVTHVLEMDDMSRAVGEVLLSDVECPVCMQYLVSPIKLCTNGHNICSKRRERERERKREREWRPTCRTKFSEIRCVALENFVINLTYPCVNKQSGCHDRFSIELIAKHHAVCEYRKLNCPFEINTLCSSKCRKSDTKNHLE